MPLQMLSDSDPSSLDSFKTAQGFMSHFQFTDSQDGKDRHTANFKLNQGNLIQLDQLDNSSSDEEENKQEEEESQKQGLLPVTYQAKVETEKEHSLFERRHSNMSRSSLVGLPSQVHKMNDSKTKSSIGFEHDNWNLMLHMIFGVSKSVRNCVVEEAFDLCAEDFDRKYLYELQSHRTKSTMELNYLFYDLCPRVFHQIRRLYSISSKDYLRSIGPENIIGSMIMGDISTVKEQCSTGKSGSFFYYTPDNRYTIKTISHNEFIRLKHILKQYYDHLSTHPQSLITKYYGLHKIKYKKEAGGIARVYFIVMANVFNTNRSLQVRYDLKGSKHGRNTRKHPGDKVDPGIALKDLDFDQDGTAIELDEEIKRAMLKQIEIDVRLF